jgi:hypothetical protein
MITLPSTRITLDQQHGYRSRAVAFRAVNLMLKAAPGYVGTTGIGGAVLAVRRLTRGC